jgi:hypothetical protein
MNEINEIIRRYWTAEIERAEAEALLIDTCNREDMACWIMEAFCRMWVSPFNLGFENEQSRLDD